MGAAAGPLLYLPLSCPVVWLRLRGSGGGIFEQWKTSMRIAAFGFLQLGFDCPRTEPGCRPQRVKERACGQCYEFPLACFQERPENLLILLQFHLQNASRTAWRADGPNIERSVRLIGCRNALSNVHRPKLLAEMGNLFPGKCALVLCCRGIGRHACPVPRAPCAPATSKVAVGVGVN